MHIKAGLGLILSCLGKNTLVPSKIIEEWGSLLRPALKRVKREEEGGGTREIQVDKWALEKELHTLTGNTAVFIVYLVFCKTQKRRQTGEYLAV